MMNTRTALHRLIISTLPMILAASQGLAAEVMNCTLDTWSVSVEDFPAAGTPVEQMEFLLNYAVLAPSNHNTQPWLFEIHGEAIHLFADRTRALPMTDPEDRELIISCGAALLHLRVEDVWASFLNQPIEVAELRPRICELVGKTGYPQILLRLGFGQTVPPTPRRPVDEVCHIRGEVS